MFSCVRKKSEKSLVPIIKRSFNEYAILLGQCYFRYLYRTKECH